MCGISGIFEFARMQPIAREVVHAMNETLRHRGPDDEGIFVGPGIGLGHRRLSIIDVAGGHQPISNEDGSTWVLLNGEIYNFRELYADLAGKGHQFATKSDTEAVVHLYEEYGDECFARLRGMFAIAIWDSRQRRLVLARDRVGKKPLFYAADHRRIIFGSELKALLAGDSLPRDIDCHALCDYFSFGYIPAPKSIYKAVRKVKAGHYLVASAAGLRETAYWDISFAQVNRAYGEQQWCEIIREQISEATRIRLMSEVPLGAFLSGGVDSSTIVAFMAGLTRPTPVTSCSIGFNDREFNESDYARQIAEQFKTDHYEKFVEPRAVDITQKLVWHYDEPFADSSAIPTYYVSWVARQRVTVALGGDGGDESFAGYRRYKFDQLENRMRGCVPGNVRRSVFGPLGRWYPGLAWAPRVFRAKATFQSLARTPLEGYFNSISIFRPDEKRRLLSPDFFAELPDYDSLGVLQHYYDRANTNDALSRIQYVDIKTYLTDDIFVKVDRASMAVSLEVRAPLVDHRLMEIVASMPSGLKLYRGQGKYILKKAMESILPANILYRPKQGFAVPLKRWFRGELKEMAREAIFGEADGLLDSAYLRRIWDQHQSGRFDRSAYLWCVLMYRMWKERFSRP